MLFSTLPHHRSLIHNRTLRFETLDQRLAFCSYSLALEPLSAQIVHLEVEAPHAEDTERQPQRLAATEAVPVEITPIVLNLGRVEPGSYSFTITIDLNVSPSTDDPPGTPPSTQTNDPTDSQPPVEHPLTEPIPSNDALTVLSSHGQESYYETFDSGQVADWWTEYAALAPVEFVRDLNEPDDQALAVAHTVDEDRIVLRKEFGSGNLDSIYATFEETFSGGFDEQPFWSLKQARVHDETGDRNGTFDFALWGIDEGFLSYVFQETGIGGQVPFKLPETDEPIRVSFFMAQNTVGQADGRLIIWRNQEPILDIHDAVFRTRDGGPTGIGFGNNYSGGPLGDPHPPLERVFDDIFFISNPTLEPELLHQLAMDALTS